VIGLRRNALILSALLAVALPAAAQVHATDAWARGTVGPQRSTAIYMRLRSPEPAAVVGVESPLGVAELHEMKMNGDVMQMRSLKRLELPAGRTVELDPAGAHIMLTGLKRPLVKGDRVPLHLIVETKGKGRRTVDVSAEVRDFAATGGEAR
jgi:copper(I)-binding protein